MSVKDISIDIPNEYNNSRYLSNKNESLLDSINNSIALQTYTIDFECPELKAVKHYFDAPVESWPVIVSDVFVNEIEQIGDKIIAILKKVLLHYRDTIIDYASLNEDQETIDECFSKFESDHDLVGLLLRFDLVISDDQFRIIEVNSGSSLGGWHLDFLELLIKNNFNKDENLKELQVTYNGVLQNAFISLFAAVDKKIAQPSGNFVIFADKDDAVGIGEIEKIFNQVKLDFFPDAKLISYSEDDQLDFLDDHRVEVNGQPIDVVLLNAATEEEVSEELYHKFSKSFLNDKIIFPDNIGYAFLGAKHLMALLYEKETLAILDKEEIALVEKYFPWTCKTKNSEVNWEGQNYQIEDLLMQHKDRFVIKKAFSSEGLDVVVGNGTSAEEWHEHVQEKLTDNRWIAQEYFNPDPVTVFSYPFNFVKKAFSWGSFNFNTEYKGSLVRAVFEDQDRVINSARGAILTVVYEDNIEK